MFAEERRYPENDAEQQPDIAIAIVDAIAQWRTSSLGPTKPERAPGRLTSLLYCTERVVFRPNVSFAKRIAVRASSMKTFSVPLLMSRVSLIGFLSDGASARKNVEISLA